MRNARDWCKIGSKQERLEGMRQRDKSKVDSRSKE